MFRGRRIVLITGLGAVVATGVSAQSLTEEQALLRMRAEHPQVRVLELTVRELEADLGERGLLANPTVSYTREDTSLGADDFLTVTQELPVRGRLGLLKKAAAQAATAARSRADADLLTFETSLRLAFAELSLAQARLDVLSSGLSELNQLADVLRTREEEGEGSRFDRLRVDREIADVEADLEATEIGRLSGQARLAAFFGPGTDTTGLRADGPPMDPEPVSGLDTLLPEALSRRSDYRALELAQSRWETERRAAERLRLPGASLSAGLKRANTPVSSGSGYALTAALSVPLFNRGQAQTARAEAARARSSSERLLLGTQIEGDVRATHAAASRYAQLVVRYRAESVAPAGELVSIATAAYEEGEYGILELLDAHRGKLSAERRLEELAAEARRASIHLDHAVGRRVTP